MERTLRSCIVVDSPPFINRTEGGYEPALKVLSFNKRADEMLNSEGSFILTQRLEAESRETNRTRFSALISNGTPSV